LPPSVKIPKKRLNKSYQNDRIYIVYIYLFKEEFIVTTPVKEVRVTPWGTSLGIRLPKEFIDLIGLKPQSLVQVKVIGGALQVKPTHPKRRHIPLAERMEKALADGTWNGKPYELTAEDREWLDMPAIGEEFEW
jgi:antitoxin component of MazEF toxin-antitoxin module